MSMEEVKSRAEALAKQVEKFQNQPAPPTSEIEGDFKSVGITMALIFFMVMIFVGLITWWLLLR